MTIHQKVTVLINELEMNPNSFSKGAGVSVTTIQNIIGGKLNKPGYDVLKKIIKAYRVNPEWLLSDEDVDIFKNDKPFKAVIIGPGPDTKEKTHEVPDARYMIGEIERLWHEIGNLKEKVLK